MKQPLKTTSKFLNVFAEFLANQSEESLRQIKTELIAENVESHEIRDSIEEMVKNELAKYA